MKGIRTRFLRIGGIATVALAGVAAMATASVTGEPAPPSVETTPVVTTPLAPSESLSEWAVAGTAQAGRVLLIASLTRTDVCHDRRAELTAVDERQVRVRNVFFRTVDDPSAHHCGVLNNDRGVSVALIRLAEPLRGRAIVGPSKRSLKRGLKQSWDQPPIRQTGLLVHDAIGNLEVFGYRRSDIRVRGPRSGYVTRITPRLPERRLGRSTKIVVHARSLER